MRRPYLVGVPRFCLTCGRRGHYSSHCPELGLAGQTQKRKPYTCTECDREGHNIRSCPALQLEQRGAA